MVLRHKGIWAEIYTLAPATVDGSARREEVPVAARSSGSRVTDVPDFERARLREGHRREWGRHTWSQQ